MFSKLLEQVDNAPAGYLFAAAFLIFQMGRVVRNDVPLLKAWQTVGGFSVFTILLLRRLFADVPHAGDEVMGAIFRAGAFGCISYGVTGVAGTIYLAIYRVAQQSTWRVQNGWARWQRTMDARKPMPAPPKPSQAELRQQELEAEQRKAELEKRETERRRKEDLRMQLELDIEFAADKQRRERVDDYVQRYTDDRLSVAEYENRLDQIREAALRSVPKQQKQYETLLELINDFERRREDVENSIQSEFEKASLLALMEEERQLAIERFLDR